MIKLFCGLPGFNWKRVLLHWNMSTFQNFNWYPNWSVFPAAWCTNNSRLSYRTATATTPQTMFTWISTERTEGGNQWQCGNRLCLPRWVCAKTIFKERHSGMWQGFAIKTDLQREKREISWEKAQTRRVLSWSEFVPHPTESAVHRRTPKSESGQWIQSQCFLLMLYTNWIDWFACVKGNNKMYVSFVHIWRVPPSFTGWSASRIRRSRSNAPVTGGLIP